MHRPVTLAAFVLLAACSSEPPALSGDGATLVYEIGDEETRCELNFAAIGGDKFLVTAEPEDCSLNPVAFRGTELLVDNKLEVDGAQPAFGETVRLWNPKSKRKRRTEWNGAEVAVHTAKIGALSASHYYDVEHGFLVGMEKEFVGDRKVIYRLVSGP